MNLNTLYITLRMRFGTPGRTKILIGIDRLFLTAVASKETSSEYV